MNKFEFKNLVKNLKDTLKEKTFFKDFSKVLTRFLNSNLFIIKYTIDMHFMQCRYAYRLY